MKEIKNGNKAIQVVGGMVFYGQYYKNEFQVLESKSYTERVYKNMVKKYGF
jgi:hypothetical protein